MKIASVFLLEENSELVFVESLLKQFSVVMSLKPVNEDDRMNFV